IYKADQLSKIQKENILKIWNTEYPQFLTYNSTNDFENYLNKLENAEHYIAEDLKKSVGWAVKFDRNNSKWFLIMVDSQSQGKSLGTKLMEQLKLEAIELNGWVVDAETYKKQDGKPYKSPIEFYIKNGFSITGERLEANILSAVKVKWIRDKK
ncbi:MAG: GNAT family N-acetyltransferase, partial [Ginsengibacter sp.]